MARPAQLGALTAEDVAGLGLIDGELEAVGLAGNDVALEEELRDVEGVDDVGAVEGDLDGATDRHRHPALARRGVVGRDELAGDLVAVARRGISNRQANWPAIAWIRMSGLSLTASTLLRVFQEMTKRNRTMAVGTTVQITSTTLLPVGLDGQVDVARPASVANDAPDDEPLDDHEDRDGEGEDDVVQAADLVGLGRSPQPADRGWNPDRS